MKLREVLAISHRSQGLDDTWSLAGDINCRPKPNSSTTILIPFRLQFAYDRYWSEQGVTQECRDDLGGVAKGLLGLQPRSRRYSPVGRFLGNS